MDGLLHTEMTVIVATTTTVLDDAKRWARATKRDVVALWIAAQDPRTPLHAKIIAGAVAAYALSPVDPIPPLMSQFREIAASWYAYCQWLR